jgi:methionyl-tRNA formyltransferase
VHKIKKDNDWWYKKPRKISVIVDNTNDWFVDYAQILCKQIKNLGDQVKFYRNQNKITQGDIAFYLSCTKLTPPNLMTKHKVNLVCHESALPLGRGFSPLTWQILEGKNIIPICLFEMRETLDEGPIFFKKTMRFQGNELLQDLRKKQGYNTIDLCIKYLKSKHLPKGKNQTGKPSFYRRRNSEDSVLDINKSIVEQFNLLRVVDNKNYPAFFIHQGKRYKIDISYYDEKN